MAFAVANGVGAAAAFGAPEGDTATAAVALALGSWTLLALNNQSTHVAAAAGAGFVWFVLRTEEEMTRKAYRGE